MLPPPYALRGASVSPYIHPHPSEMPLSRFISAQKSASTPPMRTIGTCLALLATLPLILSTAPAFAQGGAGATGETPVPAAKQPDAPKEDAKDAPKGDAQGDAKDAPKEDAKVDTAPP